MEVDVKQDCIGVDWKTVSETLKSVEMAYYEPDVHRIAFEASHTTVISGTSIGYRGRPLEYWLTTNWDDLWRFYAKKAREWCRVLTGCCSNQDFSPIYFGSN